MFVPHEQRAVTSYCWHVTELAKDSHEFFLCYRARKSLLLHGVSGAGKNCVVCFGEEEFRVLRHACFSSLTETDKKPSVLKTSSSHRCTDISVSWLQRQMQ